MQRVFNIDKWTLVPSGKALTFEGDRPRRVNLELNATGKTNIYLVRDGGNTFLARVEGRDSVEFYVNGSYSIASDGADCYLYTVDGDEFTVDNLSSESFTTVRERRERNYELEYIAAKMAENLNRRLELQADEIRKSVERRIAAQPTQPPAASLARDVSSARAAAADDGATGGDAGEAGKRGVGRPRKQAAPGDQD